MTGMKMGHVIHQDKFLDNDASPSLGHPFWSTKEDTLPRSTTVFVPCLARTCSIGLQFFRFRSRPILRQSCDAMMCTRF